MTDAPESASTGDPTTAAPEPSATLVQRELLDRLRRTNRIVVWALGGVAAVFVAATIFGAGVLVGAEHTDSDGAHYVSDDLREGGDREGDQVERFGGDSEGDQVGESPDRPRH